MKIYKVRVYNDFVYTENEVENEKEAIEMAQEEMYICDVDYFWECEVEEIGND